MLTITVHLQKTDGGVFLSDFFLGFFLRLL